MTTPFRIRAMAGRAPASFRSRPRAPGRRGALAGALLVGGGTLASALPAGAQSAAENWVGCWSVQHVEDWRPRVDRPGFPVGRDAPAPRLVLLDRIPGRAGLLGAGGPPALRAEWGSSSLRTPEAWAVRPEDGRAYLGSGPGVRAQVLLLDGPPLPEVPGMWFFRRTDTPLPEITAPVEARRVACPEGGGPHRLEVVTELDRHFAARGVEGAFVLYDAAGRRFVRSAPQGTGTRHAPGASFELPALLLALQAGLASPEGPFDWEELASSVPAARWRSAIGEYGNRAFTGGERGFWADGALRISADEQVYWLVDVLRDRAVPAARGGADAAVDPVEGLRSLTLLEDRGGARLFGSIAPDPREEEGRGWAVGWVERGEQDLFVFATYLSVRGAEAAGREVPEGIVRAILEELEVLPPVLPER